MEQRGSIEGSKASKSGEIWWEFKNSKHVAVNVCTSSSMQSSSDQGEEGKSQDEGLMINQGDGCHSKHFVTTEVAAQVRRLEDPIRANGSQAGGQWLLNLVLAFFLLPPSLL